MSSHKGLICGIPNVMEKLVIKIERELTRESHESEKGLGIGSEIVSVICAMMKVGVCEADTSFGSGISMDGSSNCISGGDLGNAS
jgi:hypothetical protein